MKIKCTISTPQHVDGKIHHYHTQNGTFDPIKLKFEPYRGMFGQFCNGDHVVQFQSINHFLEALKNTINR